MPRHNGLDERQAALLAVYGQYVSEVIVPAEWQLKALLADWKTSDYWTSRPAGDLFSPSPVTDSSTRIKRPESVLDKLTAKPDSYPEGASMGSLRKMHDLLGGRVVVYFTSDLAHLDWAVRHDPRIEVSRDDPPVAYLAKTTVSHLGLEFQDEQVSEKPSGYTSLHYIVRFRDSLLGLGIDPPWIEIQVRTLAQHAWAEIEHLLGYKPEVHVPYNVGKQLNLLASLSSVLDDEFELVRDELDELAKRGEDTRDSATLNAEVLPGLVREAGLRLPRDWVGPTVKMLASRGVTTARKFRRLVKDQELREMVDQTYKAHGGLPRDTEVIFSLANLADLVGTPQGTKDRLRARIRAQIEYDAQWNKVRNAADSRRQPGPSLKPGSDAP